MRRKQKIFGRPIHETHAAPRQNRTAAFFTQQHEPGVPLLATVRPVVAGFSPRWGNDPFQARKSQIRPCVGKVEKSPNIASKGGVKKEQVKGCGSVNRPHPNHSARQSRSLRAFSGFCPPQKVWVGKTPHGSSCGSESEKIPEFREKSVGQTVGLNP